MTNSKKPESQKAAQAPPNTAPESDPPNTATVSLRPGEASPPIYVQNLDQVQVSVEGGEDGKIIVSWICFN